MRLPADCIAIKGSGLEVDESMITGEPDPAVKEHFTEEEIPADPILYKSCNVVAGEGTALVLAVGSDTLIGSLPVIEEIYEVPSRLEEETGRYTKILSRKALVRSILAVIILIIAALASSKDSSERTNMRLFNAFSVCITLLFASIPFISSSILPLI